MSHLMNTVSIKDLEIIHAKDEYLLSKNGDKYLDWFADVGTVNLGYSNKDLMREISSVPQHIPNTLGNRLKEHTAEKLCYMTGMEKAFFCNSGSEAVEAAIKIVRKTMYQRLGHNLESQERKIIYTYKGGFHGRTYGAVSAGDGAEYHYSGFEPHLQGFKHFEKLEEINWGETLAVMLATMYGNNDAIIYPKKFITDLHYNCKCHGVPLILDEVQVGAGRTGTFNGYEYYGIEPDVVCLGKGIGCGIPTGVTLAKGDFAEALTPGTHYSTFGGSPLSCVGILHLIKYWFADNDLSIRIQNNHKTIVSALSSMFHIHSIRGKGMWIAFDVEGDNAMKLSDELLNNKMFVPTFRKNAIKITPMLNSSNESIERGLDIIRKSIKSLFGTV